MLAPEWTTTREQHNDKLHDLYVGVIVAIGAMGYGAFALGVDPMWIGIGVAVLFGLGLMGAARKAGIGRDNPDNARGPNNTERRR